MDKLVSVIIPVYNREAYLDTCVDSVRCQTYGNFEILLIDDGSTDKTPEICARLAKEDVRVKCIMGNHKGVSAARNLAIDNATGDFLFFLDSDDAIHPQLLEGLMQKTENPAVSFLAVRGCDIADSKWDDRLFAESIRNLDFTNFEYMSNQQMIASFFHRDSLFGRMGGILLRREYVGELRFQNDLKIGEDVRFIYENIIKGTDGIIWKERGYFWRTHHANTSLDVSYPACLSRIQCKEFLWKTEEKFGRIQNANSEKIHCCKNFISAQVMTPIFSKDSKQLRKTMNEYKKVLFPALSAKERRLFCLALYTPVLFYLIRKLMKFVKKLKTA